MKKAYLALGLALGVFACESKQTASEREPAQLPQVASRAEDGFKVNPVDCKGLDG